MGFFKILLSEDVDLEQGSETVEQEGIPDAVGVGFWNADDLAVLVDRTADFTGNTTDLT